MTITMVGWYSKGGGGVNYKLGQRLGLYPVIFIISSCTRYIPKEG